jgi:hypothetical protein
MLATGLMFSVTVAGALAAPFSSRAWYVKLVGPPLPS